MKTKRSITWCFAAVGTFLLSFSANGESVLETTNLTSHVTVPESVRIGLAPILPFSSDLVGRTQECSAGKLSLSFVPFSDAAFCDAMIAHYENAPENWSFEGRRIVALSYYSRRKMEKALSLFENLHAEAPDNLRVLYPLAALVSLSGSNGVSKARMLFKQGLDACPSVPFAMQYLATMLAERNYAVEQSVFKTMFSASIYENREVVANIAKMVLIYCAECPDDDFGKQVLMVHRARFPEFWKKDAGALLKSPEFAWIIWKIRKRYLEPDSGEEDYRKMKIELVFAVLPELEALTNRD